MSPKNKIYISILAVFCTLLMLGLSAQTKRISTPAFRPITANVISDSTEKDSLATILNLIDSLHQKKNDSIPTVAIDSLKKDSLPNDSTKKPKKAGLDDVVEYKANDSIVFFGNNMAYMYGQGVVNYQDIELDADEIRMNMDSSMVYAVGRPDTAGEIVGNPIYKDKSGEYESKTMQYNFKSKKGYITNIITQQGEGYLTVMSSIWWMVNTLHVTTMSIPIFISNLPKPKYVPKRTLLQALPTWYSLMYRYL